MVLVLLILLVNKEEQEQHHAAVKNFVNSSPPHLGFQTNKIQQSYITGFVMVHAC